MRTFTGILNRTFSKCRDFPYTFNFFITLYKTGSIWFNACNQKWMYKFTLCTNKHWLKVHKTFKNLPLFTISFFAWFLIKWKARAFKMTKKKTLQEHQLVHYVFQVFWSCMIDLCEKYIKTDILSSHFACSTQVGDLWTNHSFEFNIFNESIDPMYKTSQNDSLMNTNLT